MGLDDIDGDLEPAGDFLVGQPLGDQSRDFAFLPGQAKGFFPRLPPAPDGGAAGFEPVGEAANVGQDIRAYQAWCGWRQRGSARRAAPVNSAGKQRNPKRR